MTALVPALVLVLVASPAPPESIAAGAGLVIHPKSKRAYVMDARSGVVAIDATSGRVLWTTGAAAARPLVVVGETLLAQTETGEVVVLDVRDGSPFAKCPGFPTVRFAFANDVGSRSQSGALSDGTLAWIAWSTRALGAGGASPTKETEERSRAPSSGVFELDVARCKAKTVKTIPFTPPTLGYGTTASPASAEVALPDGSKARLVTSEKHVRLERKTGTVELLEKPADAAWSLTTDGAHVVLSTIVDGQEHVRVLRLADAKALGGGALPEFPYGATLLDGVLVGGNRSAFGFDLAGGKLVWQRPVRSLEDDGPRPR